MRLVALTAALFFAVLIFGSHSPQAVIADEQQPINQVQNVPPKPKSKVVKVKVGDNLSMIAERYHSTYKRIFYANPKIDDPDLIYPGQKLTIPAANKKLKPRALPAEQVVATSIPRTQTHFRAITASVVHISGSTVWDRLAQCESGGNWAINTGNGFYGGLQFTLSSWRGVGGSGYPNQASRSEQIKRAEMLKASSGWGAWPACSAKLGLL